MLHSDPRNQDDRLPPDHAQYTSRATVTVAHLSLVAIGHSKQRDGGTTGGGVGMASHPTGGTEE